VISRVGLRRSQQQPTTTISRPCSHAPDQHRPGPRALHTRASRGSQPTSLRSRDGGSILVGLHEDKVARTLSLARSLLPVCPSV